MKTTLITGLASSHQQPLLEKLCRGKKTATISFGDIDFTHVEPCIKTRIDVTPETEVVIVRHIDLENPKTLINVKKLTGALTLNAQDIEPFSIRPELYFATCRSYDSVLALFYSKEELHTYFNKIGQVEVLSGIDAMKNATSLLQSMPTIDFADLLDSIFCPKPDAKKQPHYSDAVDALNLMLKNCFQKDAKKQTQNKSKPIHSPFEFAIINLDKQYEELKDKLVEKWPVGASIHDLIDLKNELHLLVREAASSMKLIDRQTKIPTNGHLAGL